VPAFGVWALGRGAMILGKERTGGALGLEHDFVLLLQLLFEKTHWCEFTRRLVVLEGFSYPRGDAPYVGGESSEGEFSWQR
jgi:hypothetical protein